MSRNSRRGKKKVISATAASALSFMPIPLNTSPEVLAAHRHLLPNRCQIQLKPFETIKISISKPYGDLMVAAVKGKQHLLDNCTLFRLCKEYPQLHTGLCDQYPLISTVQYTDLWWLKYRRCWYRTQVAQGRSSDSSRS